MGTVGDFLAGRTVLAAIATVAVLGLFVMLCRARRVTTTVEDAVTDMLHRMSKASADLCEGLTQEAADKATPHLREMLRCVAVGITDHEGTLLSWDGEAADHYEYLRVYIERAINDCHKEHVEHRRLGCELPGPCSLHSAVVVPLIVENDVAGTLIVVSGVEHKRQIRMAEETARFVSTQLELASLQKSRQALAQAEVKALRAQISPHFVYNALNTIAALIRTDPGRARELLFGFADLSRAADQPGDAVSTLGRELDAVRGYLQLEQARFGKRLRVELAVDAALHGVPVQPLRLLGAVRDAVQRDIEPRTHGGVLTISAQAVEAGCEVTVVGGAGDPTVIVLPVGDRPTSGTAAGT